MRGKIAFVLSNLSLSAHGFSLPRGPALYVRKIVTLWLLEEQLAPVRK